MKAVQNNGWALFYAPSELLQDREIVMNAIKNTGTSLEYAPFEFRNDKEIVLEAIKTNVESLQSASYELRNDEEFISQAMDIDIESLQYANYSLRYNIDFLTRMNKENRIIQGASEQLQKVIDMNGLLQQFKQETTSKIYNFNPITLWTISILLVALCCGIKLYNI